MAIVLYIRQESNWKDCQNREEKKPFSRELSGVFLLFAGRAFAVQGQLVAVNGKAGFRFQLFFHGREGTFMQANAAVTAGADQIVAVAVLFRIQGDAVRGDAILLEGVEPVWETAGADAGKSLPRKRDTGKQILRPEWRLCAGCFSWRRPPCQISSPSLYRFRGKKQVPRKGDVCYNESQTAVSAGVGKVYQ